MSRPPLRETALAVLVGTVFGVSPISSHETLPSILAGVAAGAGTLVYRLRHRREAPVTGSRGAHTPLPWKLAPAVLLYIGIVGPVALWMYSRWTVGVWVNNHGLFMPLVIGFLAHQALRNDDDPRPQGSAWGLPLLALGLMLIVVDVTMANGYLAVAGFLLTLPGLSLLLLGAARTRLLAVPLTIAPLMAPIPNSVATHLYLRQATAWGVEILLGFLRIPSLRQGTLIEAPRNSFIVSDACSGFSTTYAAVAVAAVLACYARGPWRKAALLAAALPLALAANILRVLFLVLVSENVGAWVLDTFVHPGSGVATFMVVLVGLLFIASPRRAREVVAA